MNKTRGFCNGTSLGLIFSGRAVTWRMGTTGSFFFYYINCFNCIADCLLLTKGKSTWERGSLPKTENAQSWITAFIYLVEDLLEALVVLAANVHVSARISRRAAFNFPASSLLFDFKFLLTGNSGQIYTCSSPLIRIKTVMRWKVRSCPFSSCCPGSRSWSWWGSCSRDSFWGGGAGSCAQRAGQRVGTRAVGP